jgi:hypothetical protein
MGYKEVNRQNLKTIRGMARGASAEIGERIQVPRDLLRLVAEPLPDERRGGSHSRIARPVPVTAETPDHLISAAQLAAYLQLPISWCWRAAREGLIPHYRCGQYIRFELSQVLENLKRQGKGQ